MAEKIRRQNIYSGTDLVENQRATKMNLKKQVDGFNQSIKRKAVIRYLTIVIDFSSDSLK